MKARYDQETDTPTLVLRDAPVAESDEDKPGVSLDYDEDGNLVSLEVLDASRRVEGPHPVTGAERSAAVGYGDGLDETAKMLRHPYGVPRPKLLEFPALVRDRAFPHVPAVIGFANTEQRSTDGKHRDLSPRFVSSKLVPVQGQACFEAQ